MESGASNVDPVADRVHRLSCLKGDFSAVEDVHVRARLEAIECALRCPNTFVGRAACSFEFAEELCRYQVLEVMPRRPSTICALGERMSMIASCWRSTEDFVRKAFFGLTEKGDLVTGKLFTDSLASSDEVIYAFAPNDFPYWLADDVEHWLLWLSRPCDHETVKKELDRRLGDAEYCFAAQKQARMTIPSIYHVQVFLRRR